MEDIAAAAGMSRPAVYQYVRSKDDAYRRLATRVYDGAMLEARRAAAASGGTLAQRLDRILATKLALTQRLFDDSPYASELTGGTRSSPPRWSGGSWPTSPPASWDDHQRGGRGGAPLGAENAHEVAELALALARGLEADHTDLDRRRDRLRNGIALLVAGLVDRHPGADPG